VQPEPSRRRPRRGSLERPVSGRLYRAGWLAVLVALVTLAFTVGQPTPLPQPRLDPSFDGQTASQFAIQFAQQFPDRRPGTASAQDAARWVTERLTDYDLRVHRQAFAAEIPGLGQRELVNLVAVAPGRSPEAIVVTAHRDDLGLSPGANDNASGTGALIELARHVASTRLEHTLVFLSTDGGAYGSLGAAEFSREPDFLKALVGGRASVAAVVNLDAVGGAGPPRLLFTGETARSPAIALVETARRSVETQAGSRPDEPGTLAQIVDLAFPFSLYGQAPFVARGIPAVTLTSAGLRPPPAADDDPENVRGRRLGVLGRSAQDLLGALDQAPETASGTAAYVTIGSRFLRGWVIELVLIALLIPVLAATVDLFARLRRWHVTLGPALRGLRSRLGVWLWIGAVFALFSFAGIFPNGASRPIDPDTPEAADWPLLALFGFALLAGLGWAVARPRLAPARAPDDGEELGGHLAALLALAVVALVVAAVNPFALVFVLPSLHAWIWLPQLRDQPLGLRLAVYAAGFLGPLLLLASFAVRYEMGVDALWYLAALVSVGYVPLPLVLVALAWAAVAAQVGALTVGRYAPYPPPEERPARGPIREAIRRGVLASRRRRRLETVDDELRELSP
jgi:Peptidase family M28